MPLVFDLSKAVFGFGGTSRKAGYALSCQPLVTGPPNYVAGYQG